MRDQRMKDEELGTATVNESSSEESTLTSSEEEELLAEDDESSRSSHEKEHHHPHSEPWQPQQQEQQQARRRRTNKTLVKNDTIPRPARSADRNNAVKHHNQQPLTKRRKQQQPQQHRRRRRRTILWCMDHIALRIDQFCPLKTLHRICTRLFWVCFGVWAFLVVLQQVLLGPWQQQQQQRIIIETTTPIKVIPPRIGGNHHNHQRAGGETLVEYMRDVAEGFLDVASSSSSSRTITIHRAGHFPHPPETPKTIEEVDAPGCVRDRWQSFSFPTCNDVHDMDMVALLIQRQQKQQPQHLPLTHHHVRRFRKSLFNNTNLWFQNTTKSNTQNSSSSGSTLSNNTKSNHRAVRYLGDGLWRSVWSVNPRPGINEVVVLKSMKREHNVNERNLDRHRRDALVMERFTSSPNIVDIYSFCGNSVVSEYIPQTLQQFFDDEVDYMSSATSTTKQQRQNQGTKTAHLTSLAATTLSPYNDILTRTTPAGRLNLSLQIVQGLYHLHYKYPTGPIVHADLTLDQLLVDSTKGLVKLNDFNRCRFMAHSSHNTSQLCKFVIPTSPGKDRSPEEYSEKQLTQQLDVYALANILFVVLTGQKPWDSRFSILQVQRMIENGARPRIPSLDNNNNTTDALLAHLIERAYDFNPETRITAKELLEQLQKQAQQQQQHL